MSEYCCEMMKAQHDTVCSQHQGQDCPDIIVKSYTSLHGMPCVGIPIHDGGSSFVAINFCPWCGARLNEQHLPKFEPTVIKDQKGREVVFEKWNDRAAIGVKVSRDDGQVRYVYLNPSTTDGSDPDVFIYHGEAGDPCEDEPQSFCSIFDEDKPE